MAGEKENFRRTGDTFSETCPQKGRAASDRVQSKAGTEPHWSWPRRSVLLPNESSHFPHVVASQASRRGTFSQLFVLHCRTLGSRQTAGISVIGNYPLPARTSHHSKKKTKIGQTERKGIAENSFRGLPLRAEPTGKDCEV